MSLIPLLKLFEVETRLYKILNFETIGKLLLLLDSLNKTNANAKAND